MKSKGIGAFPVLFMLMVIAIVSVYVFFYYFKFHVSLTAVRSYNFVRFDNVPLTFYSLSVEDKTDGGSTVKIPLILAFNKDHFLGEGTVKGISDASLNDQLVKLYEDSKILQQEYMFYDSPDPAGKVFSLKTGDHRSDNFFRLNYPVPLAYNSQALSDPQKLLETLNYVFKNS